MGDVDVEKIIFCKPTCQTNSELRELLIQPERLLHPSHTKASNTLFELKFRCL